MILKCKICGGSLNINQDEKIAVCEYCGIKQSVPLSEELKNEEVYNRANGYLMQNEFDKAENLYNQILFNNKEDADAYWNVLMCRYGVTYVKDPSDGKYVPTCNRTLFESIYNDENYINAVKYADAKQKELYEETAAVIDNIQKGILNISKNEKPFDVFICYKETDEYGRRTHDSVLATDLYNNLTEAGFKVFFSRITLEDKLGQEYEPYIFAAINSAKVMVVIGTKPEYFNAVWVKNEWLRFLALIRNGEKKTLIPAYLDMTPYDLPEEFSHLQSQDMSKIGCMQDIVRGIKKLVNKDNSYHTQQERIISNGFNKNALIKRIFICLQDRDFARADELCEQVLNNDPENVYAYLGKLLIEMGVSTQKELEYVDVSFEDSRNYKKIVYYGDDKLKKTLNGYLEKIEKNIEKSKIEKIRKIRKATIITASAAAVSGILCGTYFGYIVPSVKYNEAMELYKRGYYDQSITILQELGGFKNSDTVVLPDVKYDYAVALIDMGSYEASIQILEELGDFKDCRQILRNFWYVPEKVITKNKDGSSSTSE